MIPNWKNSIVHRGNLTDLWKFKRKDKTKIGNIFVRVNFTKTYPIWHYAFFVGLIGAELCLICCQVACLITHEGDPGTSPVVMIAATIIIILKYIRSFWRFRFCEVGFYFLILCTFITHINNLIGICITSFYHWHVDCNGIPKWIEQ